MNYIKILIITLLVVSCSENNSFFIVKNGKTNYQLIYPTSKDSLINLSAKELQTYIKKISGDSIKINKKDNVINKKIVLNVDNKLSKHSISIKTKNKNVFITAGSSLYLLYGVYDFLETYLGCKWLAPDAEIIPNLKNISIPKDIVYNYTPDVITRTVHSRLFYKDYNFADKHKVTHEGFPNYVPKARVHTFKYFVPEDYFFKSHPEYYALRKGRRIPTQLCLSNENVLKIVIDSVRKCFQKYPNSSVISVSQNDNSLYCECEKCSSIDKEEGSHSGSMIRFVNNVAKEFPDKTISTLAYQYTRKPCKTNPLPNVLITLCSIECNRSSSIQKKCSDFAEDLTGWNKICNNIRIWDYTTQFTNMLAPFPNIYTLKPNIEFFASNNAKWIFEQHSYNVSELFELRSYLTAKLLWNPNLNTDSIINEFTENYYGKAGIYVRNYINIIHEELNKDKDFFLFLYGDPSQGFKSFLNPKLLNKYNKLFDKAEKSVENDSILLNRVRKARISVDYASLEMSRNGLNTGFYMAKDGVVNKSNIERLKRFENTCKKNNITVMNEMNYSVQDYINAYKSAIKRALNKNIASNKPVTLLTKPKKYADCNPQALTNGALGGSNFYSNWLGFEGNDMIATIDLEKECNINMINTAFLQVTNHIVFFPKYVEFYYSIDNKNYKLIKKVNSSKPLSPKSKTNDIEYVNLNFKPLKARYIKIIAKNIGEAPTWHNAAGMSSWIFADEVQVNELTIKK